MKVYLNKGDIFIVDSEEYEVEVSQAIEVIVPTATPTTTTIDEKKEEAPVKKKK